MRRQCERFSSGVRCLSKPLAPYRIKRTDTLLKIAPLFSCVVVSPDSWVTVGELKSAELYVTHMSSSKAKKLGELMPEKVLPEL